MYACTHMPLTHTMHIFHAYPSISSHSGESGAHQLAGTCPNFDIIVVRSLCCAAVSRLFGAVVLTPFSEARSLLSATSCCDKSPPNLCSSTDGPGAALLNMHTTANAPTPSTPSAVCITRGGAWLGCHCSFFAYICSMNVNRGAEGRSDADMLVKAQ